MIELAAAQGATVKRRMVLEMVTVADLAEGHLPTRIKKIAASPDAWR